MMVGNFAAEKKNIYSKNSRNTSSEYVRSPKTLHLILSYAISTPDAMLNNGKNMP